MSLKVTNEIVLYLPEDVNKLCRTCMTVTENILCHEILLLEDNRLTLAGDMLRDCYSVEVLPNDGLPKSICTECANKLDIAYNFKHQCKQIQTDLQKLLNIGENEDDNESEVDNKNDAFDASSSSSLAETNAKSVVLYENESHINYIDDSIVEEAESCINFSLLFQQRKELISSNCFPTEIEMERDEVSVALPEKDMNDILKLIEERKNGPTENSDKNSEECEDILTLIQERKQDFSNMENQTDYSNLENQTDYSNAENQTDEYPPIKEELESDDEISSDLVCKNCTAIFTSVRDLNEHYQTCKDLNESLSDKESTSNHKAVLEKILKLENETVNKVELYDQDDSMHDDNFLPYECNICGIIFKTVYARNGHMSMHGPIAEFFSGMEQFPCDLCNKYFSSESKLAIHFYKHAEYISREMATMETEIPENLPYKIYDKTPDKTVNNITDENRSDILLEEDVYDSIYDCGICDEKFNSQADFNCHLNTHIKSEVVTCDICHMDLLGELNLVKHLKEHGIQTFLCKICLKRFDQLQKLKDHLKEHKKTQGLDAFNEFESSREAEASSQDSQIETCEICQSDFHGVLELVEHLKEHGVQTFLCKICLKRFDNLSKLKEHIKEHTEGDDMEVEGPSPESGMNCNICHMDFEDELELVNHFKQHGAQTFLCQFCLKNFGSAQMLKLHMKSHSKLEGVDISMVDFVTVSCKICGKQCSSLHRLMQHMKTHAKRPKGDISMTEDETVCKICHKKFSSSQRLKEHIKTHKDVESSNECCNFKVAASCEICNLLFPEKTELVKHMKKHGIQIFLCKICMKRFDNPNRLKEHLKCHEIEKSRAVLRCPICKQEFENVSQLRSHSLEHLNETYECKRCRRTFNNKISWQTHEKQHTKPRFLCSLCGKQYFSSVALACHIRAHNNEKPFTCPHCKKAFTSRATLSVHKRIHSSFKPYICNYCGYSCRQSGDLAMHIRTHTGDKPYKCTFPNCDRKFTTSSQRREHYRRHTNERNHKCAICGKAFLESKTLKVHMLTHTGEKPHSCGICGKRFRRTHHLSNHLKGHRDRTEILL